MASRNHTRMITYGKQSVGTQLQANTPKAMALPVVTFRTIWEMYGTLSMWQTQSYEKHTEFTEQYHLGGQYAADSVGVPW